MSMIQLNEVQLDAVFGANGGCCEPGPAYDEGKKIGWYRADGSIGPGQNGQGNAFGVFGDCLPVS